jgi:hypothetical protein
LDDSITNDDSLDLFDSSNWDDEQTGRYLEKGLPGMLDEELMKLTGGWFDRNWLCGFGGDSSGGMKRYQRAQKESAKRVVE